MSDIKQLDPLTLPLTGLQVIEASAGTGKTWTLAALYVRLVLGHAAKGTQPGSGLYPPQILVMTFTEAATAELRGRIRARLAQAARFFKHGEQPGFQVDDFLRSLRDDIDAGQWPTCAERLDLAAQWMDEAAIFTIHGWSSRMLKTHAFDSASLFQQSRVEDSEALKLGAVQDYWRKWFYPLSANQLGALQAVASNPQELLAQLGPLWTLEDKAPHLASAPEQTPDVTIQAWEVWQQQHDALTSQAQLGWTPELVTLVTEAAARKAIKGYRADWLAGWLAQMATWQQGDSIKADTLQRFTVSRLLEKSWTEAKQHSAFVHIEALCDHLGQEPQVTELLLAHAAHEVGAAYRQAKARLAQFDFSDLLQHLYRALQAPDGRLAAAIRAQFPVALVDEFQDTDPWQYGALSKIYDASGNAPDAPGSTGLIMIGDPKQAIYSFRGADLNTYLSARQQAQAIHTLIGNFRSTQGVVAAVNHVFGHAAEPFGEVPYEIVSACNAEVLPLQVAGQAQVAMTVWHLQSPHIQRKAVWMRQMAEVFAAQMTHLLNAGAARPGAMAVLVRNWSEARAIRSALASRGVRSVYLSERDSVFATPQAIDLWRILRAVANPRASHWVRAALATGLWGLSWRELEALFQDEAAWDALSERFHQWQTVWQRQGFLPMLHQLLHEQSIPARLLAQDRADNKPQNRSGERQLTNLLHLGDLLQNASLGLQGEGALIRYLEDQLRDPQASGDTAQLRLESDADLVQVVTLHKAKGLQYPLVFLPFVANYREADSGQDDAPRLAEDIRLLYVALTRAEQALWLGITATRGDVEGKTIKVKSAVSALLGRQASGDLAQCLKAWESEHIVVQNAPEPDDTGYTPQASARHWKPALTPRRHLISRWWSASFSALTRDVGPAAAGAVLASELDERLGDAQIDSALPQAIDLPVQPDLLTPPFNAFPAGSHYGTLLHDLLEWQAQQGWPAAQNNPPATVAADWQKLLTRKAQGLKLDEAECDLLATWVPAIVSTPLAVSASSRLVLASLKPEQHWAEMAFSLKVSALDSARLDRLIAAHVLVGQPRQAMQPRQLEGMLTGFIDLVLEFEGRYYVLDYKSNKLPDYEPAQLQQAMLAHRYDVQYTLYLLALHRLLKSRLADYDYDRHVGGALYLFLRGIDQSGAGLYLDRPPKALIETLDAAFSASQTHAELLETTA